MAHHNEAHHNDAILSIRFKHHRLSTLISPAAWTAKSSAQPYGSWSLSLFSPISPPGKDRSMLTPLPQNPPLSSVPHRPSTSTENDVGL